MRTFTSIFKLTFKSFILILLLCQGGKVFSQKNIKERSENMPIISFHYGIYNPAGDLEKRFGSNSGIGLSFHYKTKSNYLIGAEGNFLFGRNVKENAILDQITSEDGEVFDKDSQISTILLFERGYTVTANIGKIFPIIGPNPNSGLLIKLGGGFMQHKIRIEHQNNRIPQLDGEYYKGYDRLSNGLLLTQFVGYHNMSNSKLTNFYIGFEFMEGFTQNRREVNFDTKMKDTTKRLDILYGLKLGWCLSIYKRTSNDYYIN